MSLKLRFSKKLFEQDINNSNFPKDTMSTEKNRHIKTNILFSNIYLH